MRLGYEVRSEVAAVSPATTFRTARMMCAAEREANIWAVDRPNPVFAPVMRIVRFAKVVLEGRGGGGWFFAWYIV